MAFILCKGISPFNGLPPTGWRRRAVDLIKVHPLKGKEIVEITLGVWEDLFRSGIGRKPFRIGVDLFPKPQIMGFFLHELIPLELARRYPNLWRGERDSRDKDLVYLPDDLYSIEIKTSSHPTRVFGNRSYAQASKSTKKGKSGYYLAVNFAKCKKQENAPLPGILRIRFGWLDAGAGVVSKRQAGSKRALPPRWKAQG